MNSKNTENVFYLLFRHIAKLKGILKCLFISDDEKHEVLKMWNLL